VPVQDCKMFSFIIKDEDKENNNDGFYTLSFHLKIMVSSCVTMMIMYDGLFCFYFSWILFN